MYVDRTHNSYEVYVGDPIEKHVVRRRAVSFLQNSDSWWMEMRRVQ